MKQELTNKCKCGVFIETPDKENPLTYLCDKCLIRLSWKWTYSNLNKKEKEKVDKLIKEFK